MALNPKQVGLIQGANKFYHVKANAMEIGKNKYEDSSFLTLLNSEWGNLSALGFKVFYTETRIIQS